MMDKINELLNEATKIDKEVNGEKEVEKREKELMEEERTRRLASYNRVKEKRWFAVVKIEWDCAFESKNKEEAIEYLKEQYKDDFNIDLNDDEIINLEEE